MHISSIRTKNPSKCLSQLYLEAVVMTSVSRPTRYLSILSSPVTNMSIGSPFIHPPQMPSENIRILFVH